MPSKESKYGVSRRIGNSKRPARTAGSSSISAVAVEAGRVEKCDAGPSVVRRSTEQQDVGVEEPAHVGQVLAEDARVLIEHRTTIGPAGPRADECERSHASAHLSLKARSATDTSVRTDANASK